MIEFPSEHEKRFILPGPVGDIDVITSNPKQLNQQAVVLICHPHPLFDGTMDNKVVHTMARAFSDLGLRSLRFNFRGVGKTQGEHDNGMGETQDALCLIDWLKQSNPDAEIWLAGFSFGGYIAARSASFYPVKQLMTIAPGVEHFDFSKLDNIHCPWLVVQGEADEVVPPDLVYRLVDQSRFDIQLIRFPDVGHFFHGQLVKLRHTLVEYYQDKC